MGIYRTAIGLIARNYPGPEAMTPGQVVMASRCNADLDSREIDRIAMGGRFAQASPEDWEKHFRDR